MILLSSIIQRFEAELLARYQDALLPSHRKALAKVFRAKLLAAITAEGLALPNGYAQKWVVDCTCVGSGSPVRAAVPR